LKPDACKTTVAVEATELEAAVKIAVKTVRQSPGKRDMQLIYF